MTLGQMIRQQRTLRGLSQGDLAELVATARAADETDAHANTRGSAPIHYTTVLRWEGDATTPRGATLRAVCSVLGIGSTALGAAMLEVTR